jgi:aminopeptidase N
MTAGISILLLALWGKADTYPRQPAIDIVHYDIALVLNDFSNSIAGTARIAVRLKTKKIPGMWLDFSGPKVDRFLVHGIETPFRHIDGRLSFAFDTAALIENEDIIVEVHYHGIPENGLIFGKNKYGRRVIFADNWPNRAHYWFPSIDHPSDKATVTFTVTAPEKYDVVANGRVALTRSLLDGRKLTQWNETKAIPTYCMVIGVAEFSVAHQANVSGIPVAWYSYPPDLEAAAEKFKHTAAVLDYFTSVLGPYPYEKLAQVQSSTRMGGMENASTIFYNESSFQAHPVSEKPVAHEIAHQWFGDSITESDWDHLWISEGFASYFEALFDQEQQGPGSLKRIMDRYAKQVQEYRFGRQAPVVDPGLTDPMQKLNPLNYQKGAWILHMLRGIVGDAGFFEGIRSYYARYRDGNALTRDFQEVMESVSGTTLDTFFQQWLFRPGWPEYRITWHWDATAGEVAVTIRQEQASGLFDMPAEIAFLANNHWEKFRIRIAGAVQTFRMPLRDRPGSVDFDPDGWLLKSVLVIPE